MRLIGGIKKYAPVNWQFILLVNFSEGEHFAHIPEGVELHVLGDLRSKALFQALIAQAKALHPDVVICCMGRQLFQWYLAAKLSGVRSKMVIIQAVPVVLPAYSRFKNWLRRVSMRCLYAKADAVVCVSDAVRGSVQELSPILSRKAQRIYNPVFDDSILSLAEEKSEIFKSYEGLNAVAVGRLNVQKDYGTMIRAAARVVKVKPNFHLHILGGGEQALEMQRLVEQLGIENHVIFHGYVANPYPYLKQADLFVMSSLWEGLPNAMVEALALGTKVVSADCIAGPREILDGGKYGGLVRPGDAEGLAEGMLRELVENRKQCELIERGRFYSVENSAKYYLSLIEAMA